MKAIFNRVLLCPPKHFNVTYSINPWMGGTVNTSKAFEQHSTLRKAIEDCGVKVDVIEQAPDLPDMVFVCNSGLVYNNKVYLSHFRYPERQGERAHYKKWFENNGFEVHGDGDLFFEGGGDAVFSSKDKLWAGYGSRSQKEVYKKVQEMGAFKTILCELVGDKYYHFDTCFFPLSPELAMWHSHAFTEETKERMKKEIELIDVPSDEAAAFACNSFSIGGTVISPTHCPKTVVILKDRGFKVVEIDMSEFMKAGGACQCLVMKL